MAGAGVRPRQGDEVPRYLGADRGHLTAHLAHQDYGERKYLAVAKGNESRYNKIVTKFSLIHVELLLLTFRYYL